MLNLTPSVTLERLIYLIRGISIRQRRDPRHTAMLLCLGFVREVVHHLPLWCYRMESCLHDDDISLVAILNH